MVGGAKFGKAALGFRTHSGWAAAVLAAGRNSAIEILDRRHVTLCDSSKPSAKQPFHAAEPMPFVQAENYIATCREATEKLARDAIGAARTLCEQRGMRLSGICVITASGRALPDLAAILASHALIHTAEGEFYRDAVLVAAKAHDITATRLKAADALSHVAIQTGISEVAMAKVLSEMGKRVGRPWTSDEKLATLAAWSLLVN
ncbi:MAG TPA: hypothetical protein VGI89_02160 [Rhizomicrobium sp.]|jgi:hypothetical protein